MRSSLVALSLALAVGCSAPQKPGPGPAPAASVPPSVAPPAAPSSAPRPVASSGPDWKDAPVLRVAPSTFALPGEMAPTKLETLWDDSTGCGPQAVFGAGDAAFVLCSAQGEVRRIGADKEARLIYKNETHLSQGAIGGDQLIVGQVGAGNGVVISVPLAGGPFRVLTRSLDGPHGLAADANAAYIVSQLKILRVTRSGDERVLARTTGVAATMAARGGELYFIDSRQPAPTASSRSFLFRVRGTGEPEAIASFEEHVDHLVVDDQAVYVHLSGRNEIVRLPKTAGQPAVVTKTFGISFGPLSDGKHLYWVDTIGVVPTVLRAKVTGGSAEALARAEPDHSLMQIALTDQHVVVMTSFSQTRLVRVPK